MEDNPAAECLDENHGRNATYRIIRCHFGLVAPNIQGTFGLLKTLSSIYLG